MLNQEQSKRLEKKYSPPDKVTEQFHNSNKFVRGLRGPFGSGKTVACVWDIFFRSCEMPAQADGVRRSKWCVIRNTYPELIMTSLATWKYWFGHSCKTRDSVPIVSSMRCKLPDGTIVENDVHFLSMDKPEEAQSKLKSLDLTGGFLNEASELDKSALDMLTSRVGRYPAKVDVGSYWSGIIMDTNPPDDDHWWYHLAEVERPKSYDFFEQEPAITKYDEGIYVPNPRATYANIQSKGFQYWLDQIPGKTEEWIKIHLMGQYGHLLTGRPVYPEYNDKAHCALTDLEPYRAIPMIVSFDFGLTPAAVFLQMTPNGRLRIFDELVAENMGIRQFVSEVVKPHIARKYLGIEVLVVGDPAGAQRSQSNERTCFDEIRAAGFNCSVARTNEFMARREAVATFMRTTVDGSPAFELSPTCNMLRKGFRGGYHYERIQVGGSEMRFKDVPAKNRFSHPHDALQYGALYLEAPPVYRQVKVPRVRGKSW